MGLRELEPAKKAVSLVEEFKKFAFKGNLIDMAVGIVIGTAFTKLVDSFVRSIVMPTVSLIMPGEGSYTRWALPILGREIPFGVFLGELVNFLIVAFAVYLFMVKFLGLLIRKKEETPLPPSPPPSRSEELLAEIRDLLKKPDSRVAPIAPLSPGGPPG